MAGVYQSLVPENSKSEHRELTRSSPGSRPKRRRSDQCRHLHQVSLPQSCGWNPGKKPIGRIAFSHCAIILRAPMAASPSHHVRPVESADLELTVIGSCNRNRCWKTTSQRLERTSPCSNRATSRPANQSSISKRLLMSSQLRKTGLNARSSS